MFQHVNKVLVVAADAFVQVVSCSENCSESGEHDVSDVWITLK